MGYDDIFEFSKEDYALRAKSFSIAELREREIRQFRLQGAAELKAGFGIGFAFHTLGISLAGSALGWRQHWIAEQKLEIIQNELRRRSLELHDPTLRDHLIPIGAFVAGEAVGLGSSLLLADATNAGALGANLGHASNALHTVSTPQGSSSFLQGLPAGAHEEVREVYKSFAGVQNGTGLSLGSQLRDHLASNTTWTASPSVAYAQGYYSGMEGTSMLTTDLAIQPATSYAFESAANATVKKLRP